MSLLSVHRFYLRAVAIDRSVGRDDLKSLVIPAPESLIYPSSQVLWVCSAFDVSCSCVVSANLARSAILGCLLLDESSWIVLIVGT